MEKHNSKTFFPVFKMLGFLILTISFLFSLTWDPNPYGSENFKMLLLPQLLFLFNKIFSKYSLWQFSRKLLIGIMKCQAFSKTSDIFVNMGPCGNEKKIGVNSLNGSEKSAFFGRTDDGLPRHGIISWQISGTAFLFIILAKHYIMHMSSLRQEE